jgi:hypothetical protein
MKPRKREILSTSSPARYDQRYANGTRSSNRFQHERNADMQLEWALVIFSLGVGLGLAGRPLLVKLFRAGMGWRKQVDEIRHEAEKGDG